MSRSWINRSCREAIKSFNVVSGMAILGVKVSADPNAVRVANHGVIPAADVHDVRAPGVKRS